MADPVEPPPLFENVDILGDSKEDDDLFISASQEQAESYRDDAHDTLNGDPNLTKLSLDDEKPEMENVPINNAEVIQDTMEQVLL
ncbi:hypothetical protein GEV33_005006 [Tenebrio molitor]|jgi:hypothetical protein|uniref:Uncharacterized protein n=1 Tax=Tenebrio molitor TaxID=7067 RepID=A0A8J6HFD6_TENMO|nr:hypothetical protein GEV33_005006 [Tenebrio molitor]